ncbi:dihydrodipicolinate synthase family protein [Myroides sp. LJL119]
MIENVPFKGVIAYPITPFTPDQDIDIPVFKKHVENLVKNQCDGIAPLGSTGVLPYLSDSQKKAIVQATIEQVSGRVPVLVGVSNLTTQKTIYHAKFAEKAGADAVMIIPMSYWKLTQDEIFEHYQAVAMQISIPIMVYNNPATSGVDMSVDLLQRLVQIPNVTMIKESSGDIKRMQHLINNLGDKAAIFNGSNPLALAAFSIGATGWCSAAPNLIPELSIGLYKAIEKGDLFHARELFYKQVDLLDFIVDKGLPRSIQAGLELLGIEAGYLKKPLKSLSDLEIDKLKQILACVR